MQIFISAVNSNIKDLIHQKRTINFHFSIRRIKPASPSSIPSGEEVITRTMADVVKDYDTDELIEYLRRKDLKLKESHFEIFQQEEITGRVFLTTSKKEYRDIGFSFGIASLLSDFAQRTKITILFVLQNRRGVKRAIT
ncbi:hypothetical protein Glove_131g31 [Diversispora epigaea]|uniref:Uncharacterized protein n=1 Tax=Diversispora epigaea TaxID=1348612 RepID=A0A397J6L1_9GLOM|nr:hypothetical protein Glove_131g31 [Diversispora epigaea]